MCNLFLPAMRQRKSGVIVNLSSGSDVAPMPLVAVYSATKARPIGLLL
ncbi:MAG: SDR family NAD(P)-dependent oxidoreductase [Candidatus Saccharibacteria bacterium]|nr:SDR family NAD(P)-dependent oxidoreductase [Candidatus Saccharibacteria bacterium]